MARRQQEWMKRRRARLIAELGGKCVHCPATEKLEFDHKDPRTKDYVSKDLGSSWRMSRYVQEAKAGLLQLLCADCNKAKWNTTDRQVILAGMPTPDWSGRRPF